MPLATVSATIWTMWVPDPKFWWEEPRFLLAPGGILALSVFGLRIYGVYRSAKNTPKRSPKVRRIERIVAISLWSFIAVGVTLLLVFKR